MEKAKKLTLSKETLRTLNDDELTDVVGGQTGVVCVNTVVCHSGICNSVACDSVALCQSGICTGVNVGQSAACSIICAV